MDQDFRIVIPEYRDSKKINIGKWEGWESWLIAHFVTFHRQRQVLFYRASTRYDARQYVVTGKWKEREWIEQALHRCFGKYADIHITITGENP